MASRAALRAGAGSLLGRGQDLILPLLVVASILVILVPLPAALMDLLLAVNITVAVIILLTTIYVRTPLEVSIFPSLLLATTLARLVLNVATTRLILSHGAGDGLNAAGSVVRSFSEFVAGDGKLVVGVVIFLIIVVIQFVVITKGTTRISEVAARFALDGMPGRQMAVDADLNAGIIDEHQARERREEITRQADFYGAMDGASKFVRGDAVAGLVIMVVNIAGGLAIGVLDAGMNLSQASAVFTRLTIGDGLVSQVPAFLISLAAGLLVTRSTQRVDLPRQFLAQLFARPQALAIAGAFLGVLVFTRLPAAPLLVLGTSCVGLAMLLGRREKAEAAAQAAAETKRKQPAEAQPRIEDYLAIDPLELEIGIGLIRLADPAAGGDLLDRIGRIRQSIAAELGIVMPKVRIRDNMRLEQNQYRIKLADTPVAQGRLLPGHLLAVENAQMAAVVEGKPGEDPVTGEPAVWIAPDHRNQVELLGYRILEPVAVLTAHLADVVQRHADELLTRDATRHLIDQLQAAAPAVVQELSGGPLSLGQVQQVLQLLLRERVSIRQLATILEALGDAAAATQDPRQLAEHVRQRLARTICRGYCDTAGQLHVLLLDPSLETRIRSSLAAVEHDGQLTLSPDAQQAICRNIGEAFQQQSADATAPIVLVSPEIRAAVHQITEAALPRLVVLSHREVTRDTRVICAGVVRDIGLSQGAAHT